MKKLDNIYKTRMGTSFTGWAVAVEKEPDFWLDGFETKKEAVAFCRKNSIKISGISNDKVRVK